MEIRQETIDDYDAVYEVVKTAFSDTDYSDGSEADLVTALRKSASFIPKLSLVAVEDDRIVGHILFTNVYIGEEVQLALAPLSVLPAYQRKGIGMALMGAGHNLAKKLGYDYSIVLGHPDYYPRAGYVPASSYGIKAPFNVPDETFMAIDLSGREKQVEGTVRYDAAFGIE